MLPYRSSCDKHLMEDTMTNQTKKDVSKAAPKETPMTQGRASAIQSRTMKEKGTVSRDDFAASAARAAARNGKVGK